MKVVVKTLDNQDAGTLTLKDSIFDVAPSADILHRVVRWQQAKRRAGTHKTKGISEIRGTTAKPYKQKGTGHARQGSRRSPQFRGGATIFGPVVRSHAHKLPKKVRALGLRMALSSKYASGDLVVLKEAALADAKTRLLVQAWKDLGVHSALVLVGEKPDTAFAKAARNIPHVVTMSVDGANVYDILRHQTLVVTKDALSMLEERLS